MDINLDDLTEEELIDLNNRIVARLHMLQQVRAHRAMLDFRIGERVWFQPRDRATPVYGMLTKYNRKSVTVITDSGEHWNVGPGLLRKVEPPDQASSGDSKIIPLRRK